MNVCLKRSAAVMEHPSSAADATVTEAESSDVENHADCTPSIGSTCCFYFIRIS